MKTDKYSSILLICYVLSSQTWIPALAGTETGGRACPARTLGNPGSKSLPIPSTLHFAAVLPPDTIRLWTIVLTGLHEKIGYTRRKEGAREFCRCSA